ncbi:MAG: type II secretion system F family protein [Actinomycetota bacterium]|nr:type II secretion system F family protein [Actinomycetota bacterium]
MGAVVGLLLSVGLLLVVAAFSNQSQRSPVPAKTGMFSRLAQQSGIPQLNGSRLIAVCASIGFVCSVLTLMLTALPVVALLAGIASGFIPIALIRRRVRIRQGRLRQVWPDAIDALLSAVRAGYSLAESVCELGEKGPAALQPAFADFAGNYRVSGSFEDSLRLLTDALADPIADRVSAALLVAHQVGGHDFGSVLRTLSSLLREDARVRGEIEARQSWTVNAARLAVAAPWITLAMLSSRPAALQAYRSAQGAAVLLAAAVLSVLAYRVMIWIGRLPAERRLVNQ